MLNSRATDRHRLIMCHCHFLYDWIYYPPVRNFSRLIKQRKRSFKRQKTSSQSLYGVNMNIEENFCPYTRKISSTNSDEKKKKKFEIVCPMENSCADVRILNEFFSKTTEENSSRIRSFDLRILLVFMCGGETNDVETFFSHLSSNFPLKITNERGETSFIVQTLLNRSNRQVKSFEKSLFFFESFFVQIELIPVSFHSLFSLKFNEFDGFILFYDRDRKAALNTMTFVKFFSIRREEKHFFLVLFLER